MSGEVRTYTIEVWDEVVMVRDEGGGPDVSGVIDLTHEGYSLLDERLNALESAGFIAEFSLSEATTPDRYTMAGILNMLAGLGPDRKVEMVAVWDRATDAGGRSECGQRECGHPYASHAGGEDCSSCACTWFDTIGEEISTSI